MGRKKLPVTKEDLGHRTCVLLDSESSSMLLYIKEHEYITTTKIIERAVKEYYNKRYKK